MQHRKTSISSKSSSSEAAASQVKSSRSFKSSLGALTGSSHNHHQKRGWILIAIVFLLAVIGLSLLAPPPSSTAPSGNTSNNNNNNAASNPEPPKATKVIPDAPTIPECETAPWRKDEDMVGTCPGIQAVENIASAADCARSCCASEACITWQYRADKGCLQTGDVRIGQEKDGPSAYCSDHPPLRWQGQKLKDGRKETECSVETWHPNEEQGQCFGLGDKRKQKTFETAQDCMEACCADKECQAWQFQKSLGCFYNKGMFSCQPSDDPIVFEPYVGRRKQQATRSYTDKHGNPTSQKKIQR